MSAEMLHGAERMNSLPTGQVPGIYRRRVGDVVVTALNEGYIDFDADALLNISPEEVEQLLAAAFRPLRPRITVNAFAVHSAGRVALIDAGSGATQGPNLGRLHDNLAAAEIAVTDIDAVLLTHMHSDHSFGLTNATGDSNFKNATLRLHQQELAYWLDDAYATASGRAWYFEKVRAQVRAYRDRLETFARGEVFPGITAMPTPGHTPGHTAYLIESHGQSLLIWGDIVHVPEIQIRRPQTGMDADIDRDMAVATRIKLLDRVASDRLLIAGMHTHFPGFAHIVRDGATYALIPEAWSSEL
jgi:glyoxylase-like metal-dependent hydrolase (beta-lactamase superfamily II)